MSRLPSSLNAMLASPRFLPLLLTVDAAACALTGLVQAADAAPLSRWLGLPSPLLFETGLFLLAFAAVLLWVSRRAAPPRAAVALIAGGNAVWGLACFALLAGPWLAPSALGGLWLGAQGLYSLVVADLQWMGLRSRPMRSGLAIA